MSTLKKISIVSSFAVLIVTITVILVLLGQSDALGGAIQLPLLAIAGVVCLLVALTLVAIAFGMMGLADKTQALALPEGSVRAVIALALVVIFAIVSVYLYGSLASGDGRVKRIKISTEEANDMAAKAQRPDSAIDVLSVVPVKVEKLSNGPVKDSFVRYRDRLNPAASEFAKQLLILIGTLVTSVAGFYFGSRAATEAQESVLAPLAIESVLPTQVDKAVGTAQVAILGSGLDRVKGVKLANPSQSIDATIQKTNPGAVAVTFPVTAAMVGDWEFIVTPVDGESVRHPFKVV